MISIKGLAKSYHGTPVFHDLDLEIPDGSTTVIIGGSGCGKSTLLRCINRLEKPDAGTIEIDGENILSPKADLDRVRRKLGMVYQSFQLFSHLNVMENMILAPTRVLGLSKQEAMRQAEELLALVGMENRRYAMPDQLSGGQKQRVAIARALAMKPEAMLFDEPTSALDPTMVDEVESVIRRLVSGGMTSVIVTHEMRFARSIASNVVFLAEHSVYEQGPPEQLFEHPARELTRRFLSRSRMFERTVTQKTVDIYALCSEMRSFSVPYGLSQRQSRGMEHFCDELLLPLLRAAPDPAWPACVRLIAEEGGACTLSLALPAQRGDPLAAESIDEMGLKIVAAFTKSLTSEINADGVWEIRAAL